MLNNKKFNMALKLVVSIGLVAWVIGHAGIDSKESLISYLKSLASTNTGYLLLAILIIPVMDLVSSVKWYYLSKAQKLESRFYRLFQFYIIGRFFNLVLPSSIGGDLIRIQLQGREHNDYAKSVATVALERVTGLIVLLVYTGAVVMVISSKIVDLRLIVLLILFSLALFSMCLILLSRRAYEILNLIVLKIVPKADRLLAKLTKFRSPIVELSSNRRAMYFAFLNSVIFYAFAVLNAWISIRVFNADVSFFSMLIAVPIIMFIMNIPISIGNIGLMEFAHISTLSALGFSVEVGLSLAVLMRVKSLLAAGMGGFFYYMLKDPEAQSVRETLTQKSGAGS